MFIFPAHLLNPEQVNARVVPRVIDGGTSISGEEDLISIDGGGRWYVDYSGIMLDSPSLLRLWNAWRGYLAGGTVECLVPLLTFETAPIADLFKSPILASDFVTDDDVFPTSVEFSAMTTIATIAADAALRATSIEIDVSQGGDIKGGETFSVGERAYNVIRNASGILAIEPPLREAISDGDSVNFDWPMLKCKMAPGSNMDNPISFGNYAETSVSFVEVP